MQCERVSGFRLKLHSHQMHHTLVYFCIKLHLTKKNNDASIFDTGWTIKRWMLDATTTLMEPVYNPPWFQLPFWLVCCICNGRRRPVRAIHWYRFWMHASLRRRYYLSEFHRFLQELRMHTADLSGTEDQIASVGVRISSSILFCLYFFT